LIGLIHFNITRAHAKWYAMVDDDSNFFQNHILTKLSSMNFSIPKMIGYKWTPVVTNH
jgi:hypothetical protein